jgi:fructose-bisphosphate aldolase, class I
MARIFRRDGRTVVVAMDHGMGLGVLPALNKTGPILAEIGKGGADAVLTSIGIAKRHEQELKQTGLILRIDGGSSMLGKSGSASLLFELEEALKMGADAVACMGFPGTDLEKETFKNIAFLGARCREWGIPLMAEMLPGGFGPEPAKNVETISLACRIGAELGADIIKTTYVGTPEEFASIVEGCFVPVIVLGGAHTSNASGLFGDIEQAVKAGGAGVAIGRNVWNNPSPKRYTEALVKLVHRGKSAEEVLAGMDA